MRAITIEFMDLSDSLQAQLAAKFGTVNEEETQDSSLSTAAALARIVTKVTGEENVTSYADLDSLDRIEIAVRAEQEFQVQLGDEDVAKLKSVDELAQYIDKLKV